MARIDTLANFLTDVATAIKNKTGKTDAITPANFDTEIESIESGGGGKYAPRFISFYQYTGTELNDEIANLDTSNITSFANMFNDTGLTSVDISHFNTSNVTNIDYMFYGSDVLVSTIDMSAWDLGKLYKSQYVFQNAYKIPKIILPKTGTCQPSYINNMFYNCQALTELDLGVLDTSKVSGMSDVFNRCYALEELDLSSWNTDKVTIMRDMFNSMRALKDLKLFKLNHADNRNLLLEGMFQSAWSLDNLDFTEWDTSDVTSMQEMFADMRGLTSLDISMFVSPKVTSFMYFISSCPALTWVDASNLTSDKATDIRYMFRGNSALRYLDIRSFDFTKPTNASNVFTDIPADCEIIVMDETQKEWVLTQRSDFTNVKTVAELEAA